MSPAAHGGKQPLLAQRFTGPPQEAGKEVGKQLPELLCAAQGKHHLGDGTGDLQRNMTVNHLFRQGLFPPAWFSRLPGAGGLLSVVVPSATALWLGSTKLSWLPTLLEAGPAQRPGSLHGHPQRALDSLMPKYDLESRCKAAETCLPLNVPSESPEQSDGCVAHKRRSQSPGGCFLLCLVSPLSTSGSESQRCFSPSSSTAPPCHCKARDIHP